MSKDKSKTRNKARRAADVADVLESCAKACGGIAVAAEPKGDTKKSRRDARRAQDISAGIVVGYQAALEGAARIARHLADGNDPDGVDYAAVMALLGVINDAVPGMVEGGEGR